MKSSLRLEYFTLSYNVLEAVIAVVAGAAASSVALIGFGIDAVIEVSSGLIMLWRLNRDGDHAAERQAEKWIGYSFIALAAYVLIEASLGLWHRETPQASFVGVALALTSVIIMPIVAARKRRVAIELDSAAMVADSRQTALCSYLSGILLFGLAANAFAGWWWADAVAGLIMVPIIAKEGFDAIKGRACSHCHH